MNRIEFEEVPEWYRLGFTHKSLVVECYLPALRESVLSGANNRPTIAKAPNEPLRFVAQPFSRDGWGCNGSFRTATQIGNDWIRFQAPVPSCKSDRFAELIPYRYSINEVLCGLSMWEGKVSSPLHQLATVNFLGYGSENHNACSLSISCSAAMQAILQAYWQRSKNTRTLVEVRPIGRMVRPVGDCVRVMNRVAMKIGVIKIHCFAVVDEFGLVDFSIDNQAAVDLGSDRSQMMHGERGYEISGHNVYTLFHQIVLLAGFAKLFELAANDMRT